MVGKIDLIIFLRASISATSMKVELTISYKGSSLTKLTVDFMIFLRISSMISSIIEGIQSSLDSLSAFEVLACMSLCSHVPLILINYLDKIYHSCYWINLFTNPLFQFILYPFMHHTSISFKDVIKLSWMYTFQSYYLNYECML